MLSGRLPRKVTVNNTLRRTHRFNELELAPKGEKWNVKPRLACVNVRRSPSRSDVGVLLWTCRSEGK